jgi:hypothetical protein
VVKGMHFLTKWIIVPGYAITNYCFRINNQEEKSAVPVSQKRYSNRCFDETPFHNPS